MTRLIRLYISNVALGFGLAAVFVALLVWQDVAGIGELIVTSDLGIVAALGLWVVHGLLFTALRTAVAVIEFGSDDLPRGGLFQRKMIPIRVEATAKARTTRR